MITEMFWAAVIITSGTARVDSVHQTREPCERIVQATAGSVCLPVATRDRETAAQQLYHLGVLLDHHDHAN
jgi:hypothetical protein